MTRLDQSRIERTLKLFGKKTVLTLAQITASLGCAPITGRIKLKRWKAIHSFNKNGKYYVLPEVAYFDKDGLWQYRDIRFSKYGNLKQTVIGLVTNSKAGLTILELKQLLGIDPRSFSVLFRDHPEIVRHKHEGRFIYFAQKPTIHQRQQGRRLCMIRESRMPSDHEAVAILVQMIKKPALSSEQLSVHLKTKGYKISSPMIDNLLAREGLTMKKKSPSS